MRHRWEILSYTESRYRCEKCGLVRETARIPRKNGLGECDGWRYTDHGESWLMHATDGTPPCAGDGDNK